MSSVNLSKKERIKKILEERRKKDLKPVTGIFRWYESPGGTLVFPFLRYKEDGVIHYTLEDSKTYTVPMMIATHLNTRYRVVHKHRIDDNGKVHQEAGRKIHRTGFIPTDFMDISDINEMEAGSTNPILTVTR